MLSLAVVLLFAGLFQLAWTTTGPAEAAVALQTEPVPDPCAPPEMRVRNAAVNVREGPDPNYPILVVLRAGETLPLAGRHHGFRWWAVTLPDGTTGWVWESGVAVSGNITSAPLLPAPPLNGVVPDTTEEWTPSITTPCLATPEPAGEATTEEAAPVAVTTDEPAEQDAQPRDGWSLPVNLSESGGASAPALVVDSANTVHAFWQDVYAGYVYSRLEETMWAAPITLTVPFSQTEPHLFADANDQIQALWIGEDGALEQSKAIAATLTEPGAWEAPLLLAEAASAVAAAVDEAGQIHLAYLRPLETVEKPAGIYYQRSPDGGASWSEAELLYASPYLRGSRPADNNVQIVTTTSNGETNVLVAWDNRPRKRLFFIQGRNGGEEWHAPVEVAGPDSTSSIILPFGVRLSARDNQVLLVWQYGQPGGQCRRQSQFSTDLGQSWSAPQVLVDLNPGFASCANDNQLYAGDSLFYLLTAIDSQLHLQAWDGEQWSDPQRQTTISTFNDPDTLNTVVLDCHQGAVLDGPHMVILACGTGSSATTGDIWFTSRSLGASETWFPHPAEWSRPTTVALGAADEEWLNLLSDRDGTTHALWTAQIPEQERKAVYYSRQDGDRWLAPVSVSAAFGAASAPDGPLAVAIAPDDRLFAVWQNGDGILLLSQAAVAGAAISTEWAPPVPLPIEARTNGVALAVEANGAIDVVYSVPVNDGRGVYLLRSPDRGASWSEPVVVVDAAALGWEIAGAPQLALSASGALHILAVEESLQRPASVVMDAVYAVRCATAGETCTEPVPITQNQPGWSSLVASGPQTLHHLWQEQNGDDVLLRHQYSVNEGGSWSERQQVARMAAAEAGPLAVAPDRSGRLHLFQVEAGTLIPWIWEEGAWRQDRVVGVGAITAVRGSVSDTGTVTVLMAADEASDSTTEEQSQPALVTMSRLVELGEPAPQPEPVAGATPVATPTESPAATPAPAPSATAVPVLEDGEGTGGPAALPNADNPVVQIGVGLVPVALLVAGVLALGARAVWLRRRY